MFGDSSEFLKGFRPFIRGNLEQFLEVRCCVFILQQLHEGNTYLFAWQPTDAFNHLQGHGGAHMRQQWMDGLSDDMMNAPAGLRN